MQVMTREKVSRTLRRLVRRTRMIVEIKNACLVNVWEESFKDKQTGETVKFYRSLLNCAGEPPAQFAVLADDYDGLVGQIGTVGKATVEIDAQPGRRARVILRVMQ